MDTTSRYLTKYLVRLKKNLLGKIKTTWKKTQSMQFQRSEMHMIWMALAPVLMTHANDPHFADPSTALPGLWEPARQYERAVIHALQNGL